MFVPCQGLTFSFSFCLLPSNKPIGSGRFVILFFLKNPCLHIVDRRTTSSTNKGQCGLKP